MLCVVTVDGVWAQWASWSSCNVSCGGGYQMRQRNCSFQDGAPKGKSCPGKDSDRRSCNINECPGMKKRNRNFSVTKLENKTKQQQQQQQLQQQNNNNKKKKKQQKNSKII